MNKRFFIGIGCLLLTLFVACTSEDNLRLIPVKSVLEKGMIKFTENIGEWDEGVIYAEESYVLLKNESEAQYVQFITPDEEYDCCIYANKETHLPEQLSFENETYYFSYSGDSLLTVMFANDTGIEPLGFTENNIGEGTMVPRSKSTSTTITFLDRDDDIQKVVKALNKVLELGEHFTSNQVGKLKKALNDISVFYYYEDIESIIDELDLCREEYKNNDSIIWCFSRYATEKKVRIFNSARYAISLRNGNAFGTKPSSAIVCGEIYCPSQEFMERGKCGIIYSTDPDNLTLENNMGCVYADLWIGRTFYAQLAGLKANTTYYYKAFYDFTTHNHGNLCFRYGNKDADNYVVSDFHMREFTTKEGIVEITSFNNHYDFWYDIWYDDNGNSGISGAFYPCINISTDGIYSIYGWEVKFKHSMSGKVHTSWDYKEMTTDGELFSLNTASHLFGGTILDKWEFDKFISGENAVKVILYLSPTQSIESDWFEFRYEYNQGICPLN